MTGAGGDDGVGVVAQAPPDGCTFLIDSAAFLTVPHAVKGLTFDHATAFTPVLAQRAGIKLEHVPCRGGAEAARDLAAGTLPAVIITANSLNPVLQDCKAIPLGLTTAGRRGGPPGVRPVAEQGFPGLDVPSWNGVLARAGTPDAVVVRMAEALNFAMASPAVVEGLARIGALPLTVDPAATAARLQRERALVAQVIRDANIVLQ